MKNFLIVLASFTTAVCNAGEVEIVNVQANKTADQTYSFQVTLKHADTGWDHYANQWQVLTLDNQVLGTRTLYHPHVDEQPFTRSLGGVKVPANTREVLIRARDKVHGVSSQTLTIKLP